MSVEPSQETEDDFLAWAYDTLREINPSNYDHDDVCGLNAASVEVILAVKARRAALAKPAPEPAGGDVREARQFDPYILKAMAENYAAGHCWDHLDGQACLEALSLIESLQAQVAALSSSAGPAVEAIGYMRAKDNDGNSFWCSRQKSAYYTEPLYAHPAPATEAAGWAAVYDGQMKSCHRSRDTCVADAEHYHAVHPVYLGPAWRHQED